MAISVNGSTITLVGEFSTENAESLKSSLLDMLQANGNLVEVHAEEITRLDLAALQVLLAAKMTLEAQGGRFVMVNPSQVVKTLLEETGINMESA